MSRYAAVHANPQGPGDSRPTAIQIVHDNNMEGKLAGKIAIITGVSSATGLGIETVRALELTGAKMFLTARDVEKAKAALSDIWKEDRMELIQMDQTSLESVRAAAKNILTKTDQINLLICNAAIMGLPELQLTEDGFELHFITNHLSHFLFFQLLKPALLKGTTPEFQSRVVMLGASGHRMSRIGDSDDYAFQKSEYVPRGAYARSKTANTYMANEIERRYGQLGLHSTSLHPGIILTPLSKFIPDDAQQAMAKVVGHTYKNIEQGAATTLVAAIGKEWEGRGGVYLSDCAAAERGEDDGLITTGTYVSYTYDAKEEARLWKDSLALVGLADDD